MLLRTLQDTVQYPFKRRHHQLGPCFSSVRAPSTVRTYVHVLHVINVQYMPHRAAAALKLRSGLHVGKAVHSFAGFNDSPQSGNRLPPGLC